MSKKIGLSRRQALAGLGTIGLASVGAGVGTSALFSDEESLTDNSLTAGELDLSLNAQIVETSADFTGNVEVNGDVNQETATNVNGNSVSLNLADIKPGDYFVLCVEAIIDSNPGYLAFSGTEKSDLENNDPKPEPEPANGSDGYDPNGGDLDDALEVTIGADANANDGTWDGEITTVEFGPESLDSFLSRGGILYRGSDGHGTSTSDPLTEVGPGSENSVIHYIKVELPQTVGNAVMGDSVTFDLVWNAWQARNNSGPLPGQVGSGFGDIATAGPKLSTQALFAGNSTNALDIHTQSGQTGSGPNHASTKTWTKGESTPFTIEMDPSDNSVTYTVGGTTVEDSDVTDGSYTLDTNDPLSSYNGDVAFIVRSDGANKTASVSNLLVNGNPVFPSDLSSTDELQHINVFGALDFTSGVQTISGELTFEGTGLTPGSYTQTGLLLNIR